MIRHVGNPAGRKELSTGSSDERWRIQWDEDFKAHNCHWQSTTFKVPLRFQSGLVVDNEPMQNSGLSGDSILEPRCTIHDLNISPARGSSGGSLGDVDARVQGEDVI